MFIFINCKYSDKFVIRSITLANFNVCFSSENVNKKFSIIPHPPKFNCLKLSQYKLCYYLLQRNFKSYLFKKQR